MSLDMPINIATLFKTSATGASKELSLCAYALNSFARSSVEVKPKAHFTIDLDAQADLKTIFSLLNDLSQFITMLVGEPSYVKKLQLYDSGKTAVDVFFPSTIRKEKEIDFAEMCFPLCEISNTVQALAESWFSSLGRLGPVYDFLFGTLFGQDRSFEPSFST